MKAGETFKAFHAKKNNSFFNNQIRTRSTFSYTLSKTEILIVKNPEFFNFIFVFFSVNRGVNCKCPEKYEHVLMLTSSETPFFLK